MYKAAFPYHVYMQAYLQINHLHYLKPDVETIPKAKNLNANSCFGYNHAEEMEAFFETRAGVKELVDSGITKIPSTFIHPPESFSSNAATDAGIAQLQIPVIDLKGFESDRRRKIVDTIRVAAQTWGIFRMVNHGVPISIMENMLDGVRRFHKQPQQVKKAWFSGNETGQKIFDYNTNIKVAAWRDTVACEFPYGELIEEAIPQVCRKTRAEYLKYKLKLKETLSELLSEYLGLRSDYLASTEAMKGALIACRYHPPCPQPKLT